MRKKPFYEKYYLAVCQDGDDPIFCYSVYFLNDSDETITVALETDAFVTTDDQVYQTPVARNKFKDITPGGHVVIENDDEGVFDFLIQFRIRVEAPSGNEALSFCIPKYLPAFHKAIHIPLLNKEGWLIEEGGLWERDKKKLARCDEALEKNPKDKKAWYAKGRCFETSCDWDRAIACFDEALQIDPEYAEAWCEKANALDRPGLSSQQAVECFNKALQIRPNYKKALSGKAEAISALNQDQ
jgi:tetratricopeptide (TPR) repeat protein